MSATSFDAFYPRWREFAELIDPAFSSSFWRRVTAGTAPEPGVPEMQPTEID